MFGQIAASPSIDELSAEGNERVEPAPADAADFAHTPQPAAEVPGILYDIGNQKLLPALVPSSAPRRRGASARLPLGSLLYLVSIAFVATATIGVFFGVGFFLLGEPTEPMIPAVARNHNADLNPPLLITLSRFFGNSSSPDGKVAVVPIEPEIPLPAAEAVLPPAPPVQSLIADQTAPPAKSDAAAPPPIVDLPASNATDEPSAREVAGSSEPAEPPAAAPAPAATAPEPAPGPLPGTVAPAPSAPVLSAAEIAELLARGDTFLRIGDVTSARLFYERAANAGNGQAALRMGATFDPAFLARAGLRGTLGDPAKANSWYGQALVLSVAEAKRHAKSVVTDSDRGPQ